MTAIAASASVTRRLSGMGMIALLGGVLSASVVLSLGVGAMAIAPGHVLGILFDAIGNPLAKPGSVEGSVVLLVRLPRVVLGAVAGAILVLAGATMQALFRNPLADPGVLGVSAGAAAGAVAMIVLGERLQTHLLPGLTPWLVPCVALLGGLAATAAVYVSARGAGASQGLTLLLAGIAVNAMAMAVTGMLTFLSNDAQLRNITFWMLGSLAHGTWQAVTPAAVLMAAAMALMLSLAARLDVLLLGEREARHLGIDPAAVRRQATLGVGAAVAITGVIGFVGIVAPHLVRLIIGPGHRALLPASALLGASLLLLADMVARTAVAPADMPIGIVTAFIGGPFFLWLLMRRNRRMAA